jgi:hypothetical protein
MPDPNFLLIGAQKCGTTWLWRMLREHPDVFTPEAKELHFFNKATGYARGLDWYREQFAGHAGEIAIGECTPNYFWTSRDEAEILESGRTRDIPALVNEHYPGMKLMVLLRDPVDRAVSAYYHHINAGRVAPGQRIFDVGHRFGIISMGWYDVHLEAWLGQFPRDQLMILFYEEDITAEPVQTLREVYRFVGVDDAFEPENVRAARHVTDGPLYLWIGRHSRGLARRLKALAPGLMNLDPAGLRVRPEERDELRRLYRDHDQRLEQLLGRSLPWPASETYDSSSQRSQ